MSEVEHGKTNFYMEYYDEEGLSNVCKDCTAKYVEEHGYSPHDMYQTVTAEILAAMVCTKPGCDCDGKHLFLNLKCHPRAGAEVFHRQGYLYLQCKKCLKPQLKIKITGNMGTLDVIEKIGAASIH